MKGDDIARRLLVLCFVRQLPGDYAGRHIGRQLVRAATAGGANYEESRSAESRADFAHGWALLQKKSGNRAIGSAASSFTFVFSVPCSTFRSAHEMRPLFSRGAQVNAQGVLEGDVTYPARPARRATEFYACRMSWPSTRWHPKNITRRISGTAWSITCPSPVLGFFERLATNR